MAKAHSMFASIGVEGLRRQIKLNAALKHVSFISGPPGVGKTRIVEQVAAEMGFASEAFIVSQMMPEDIGGIVAADMANRTAVRLMPDIIDTINRLRESSGTPVLAFFDEVNNGSQLMFGALMNLLLERKSAGYAVPEDTVFVAAGNPPEVSTVAQELPAPLLNRMAYVYFDGPTNDEFMTYGASRNIHPAVLGFFRIDGNGKYLKGAGDFDSGEPQPTPRSWESVSQVLNAYDVHANTFGMTRADRMIAVASRVGERAANLMEVAIKYGDELERWENIMRDPGTAKVPSGFVPCFMQTVAVNNSVMDAETFAAAFTYMKRLPSETMALFGQAIAARADLFKVLTPYMAKNPEALRVIGGVMASGGAMRQAISNAANNTAPGAEAAAV